MTRPAADYKSYREPTIESDYQDVGSPIPPFASTSSFQSYDTFPSLSDRSDPSSLAFDLENWKMKWKQSQDDLERARERALAQEEMYQQELRTREACHQRELEYARAGHSGDTEKARGKRRG